MLSSVSALIDHIGRGSGQTLTLILFLFGFAAAIGSPGRLSLTTSATAWLAVFTLASVRTKSHGLRTAPPAQVLAWAAGGLLALATVCERSIGRRDLWWAKVETP